MRDTAGHVRRARFYKGNGRSAATSLQSEDFLEVDFNPTSLKQSVTRSAGRAGNGQRSQQYSRQTETSLSMELVFDSTPTGEDVRKKTQWLAQRISASAASRGKEQDPPLLIFEWGTYQFSGVLSSFSETLDFFSADGIPLRAGVGITLEGRDAVRTQEGSAAGGWKLNLDDSTVVPAPAGQSVTALAARAGARDTGRALAAKNQEENMRLPQQSTFVLSGAPKLYPAPPFAPQSKGATSVSPGLGAERPASSVGPYRSAGVAASDGAFAALRSPARTAAGGTPWASALQPGSGDDPSRGSDSDFTTSGRATNSGASVSLRAQVGAALRLSDRLRFDEE